MAELPLIRRSLIEHEALIAEAKVPELLRRTGWIKLFRSDATLAQRRAGSRARQAIWRRGRGARCQRRSLRASRNLTGDFAARSIFPRPASFPIPADSPRPMRRCSAARAGAFWSAMPERSNKSGGRWRVATLEGTVTAREVVVAMGPWSDQVFAPARLFDPAQRQARLSFASQAARQCRAQSSRAGYRSGLSAGADEPRHSPDHRRRVCPPRRAADAGPGRAGAAAGARAVSAGRAGRRQRRGWARGPVCRICCR